MTRAGSRGPGSSPRRPASSRPSASSRSSTPRTSAAPRSGSAAKKSSAAKGSGAGASKGAAKGSDTATAATSQTATATSGSAQGSRPATPARSIRLPRAAEQAAAAWRARLASDDSSRRKLRRVAMGAVLLFLVILVAPTLRAYVQQQNDISALRDKVAEQQKTVSQLQDEQARWDDPAFVEQQARTRLKFVKVGEKSYTVLDPVAEKGASNVARAGGSTDPWYDSIWSSMQAADVPANQRR